MEQVHRWINQDSMEDVISLKDDIFRGIFVTIQSHAKLLSVNACIHTE